MQSVAFRSTRLAVATFLITLLFLFMDLPSSARPKRLGGVAGGKKIPLERHPVQAGGREPGAVRWQRRGSRQSSGTRASKCVENARCHSCVAAAAPVHVFVKGGRCDQGKYRMVDRLMPRQISLVLFKSCIVFYYLSALDDMPSFPRLLSGKKSTLFLDARQTSSLAQTTQPHRWHHKSGASEYLKTGVGLCVSPMCLLDYKGFRMVAQVSFFV